MEISKAPSVKRADGVKMTAKELDKEIKRLERNMKEYARLLEYELAAVMRDQIIKLRGEMQKARDKKK